MYAVFLSTSELYIWQNKMLDTRHVWVLLCLYRIITLNRASAHYMKCLLSRELGRTGYWVTSAACAARNGWWIYAAAHWTARCRKWAAGSHIWQEVLNAHWDGCVCVRESPSSHYSWWLLEETDEADLFTHCGSVLRDKSNILMEGIFCISYNLYKKNKTCLFIFWTTVWNINYKQELYRKKGYKFIHISTWTRCCTQTGPTDNQVHI